MGFMPVHIHVASKLLRLVLIAMQVGIQCSTYSLPCNSSRIWRICLVQLYSCMRSIARLLFTKAMNIYDNYIIILKWLWLQFPWIAAEYSTLKYCSHAYIIALSIRITVTVAAKIHLPWQQEKVMYSMHKLKSCFKLKQSALSIDWTTHI